jgi:hypothetical protein
LRGGDPAQTQGIETTLPQQTVKPVDEIEQGVPPTPIAALTLPLGDDQDTGAAPVGSEKAIQGQPMDAGHHSFPADPKPSALTGNQAERTLLQCPGLR